MDSTLSGPRFGYQGVLPTLFKVSQQLLPISGVTRYTHDIGATYRVVRSLGEEMFQDRVDEWINNSQNTPTRQATTAVRYT